MADAAVSTFPETEGVAVATLPASGRTGRAKRGLGAESAEVAAAYEACREVARTRARNFYYGLRLTPEPRRSAIYSIYAWMRAADDAVDEPGTGAARLERLSELESMTEAVLAAAAHEDLALARPAGPLGIALAVTLSRYPLDPTIFAHMLEALRTDAGLPSFQTDSDLTRYCYGVAGTAGLACVSIWGLKPGADPERARVLAEERGQAFQRTNILRDFAQDFDEGRVYLPREVFARHGVSPEEVRAWRPADRCAALMREQASVARGYYRSSAALESMIDPACTPTLWAMTEIYGGLLEQIEADPARIVGPRIRLASARKASIAIRAAIGARMRRW